MTHREVLDEAKAQFKPRWPWKLAAVTALVILLLLLIVSGAPAIVRHSSEAGMSSYHIAAVSHWLTVLVMSSIAGIFIVSKGLRIMRFCHEMCERGRAIELSRLQTPQNESPLC